LRAPFEVELKGLGCFGPADEPRVVWLGVSEGGAALVEAERAVRNCLAVEDFPWDNGGRDFLPHLTLGRLKSRDGLDRLQKLLGGPTPPGVRTRADRLALFESRLSASGPSHAVLRESPLKG
jgi:2'-5' RNA ligase